MTVSIHATSGWALVISLYQSTALPTQLRRQGGRAEETDSFPSFSLSLSPPFFLFGPSVSLTLTQTLLLWRLYFIIVPSCNLWLSASIPLSSAPLCVSARSEWDKWVSSLCVSVPPSLPPCHLSVCRHAHRDDQQTFPAPRGPQAASFPLSRNNLPSVICSYASQLSPPRCP